MDTGKEGAVRDFRELIGNGALSALKDYVACKKAEYLDAIVRADSVEDMYRTQGSLRALEEIFCELQLEGVGNGR